jgi:hypothetical protein
MYVNGKMRAAETIQRWGEGIKDNDAGSEFNYDI